MTYCLGLDFELALPLHGWSDEVQVGRFEQRMAALGTKDNPTIINGVQLHPDSLACEFAILEPASSVGDFMMKFQHARETAQAFMGTHLSGYDWIDTANLPLFDPDICPTVVKAANTFGCSPDHIVLPSGKVKYRDVVPQWVKTRTLKECSGHLHIDLPDMYCHDEQLVADAVRNYYSRTRMLHNWTHPTQRPWYRSPMVFRPKSYGFEYRSLGASLADNQAALEMAVTQAFRLMDELDEEANH